MKKLYSPQNEAELAVIRSILEGEDIHFFVHNDHFGTMRIGPPIELFNAKTIMVSEDDFERACEILSDYQSNVKSEVSKSEYSLKDKIRMVIETLIFSWFIPGSILGLNCKGLRLLKLPWPAAHLHVGLFCNLFST